MPSPVVARPPASLPARIEQDVGRKFACFRSHGIMNGCSLARAAGAPVRPTADAASHSGQSFALPHLAVPVLATVSGRLRSWRARCRIGSKVRNSRGY